MYVFLRLKPRRRGVAGKVEDPGAVRDRDEPNVGAVGVETVGTVDTYKEDTQRDRRVVFL